LKSRDFNGFPIYTLLGKLPKDVVRLSLTNLLGEKLIDLVFGDIHPNPHIKAFKSESISTQIDKLNSPLFEQACVYPSKYYLEHVVDKSKYFGCPYTLELKLGNPALVFRSFDLTILEVYRNDPRYIYKNDDIRGWISVRDEYFENDNMAEKDQVLLEHFGFSFNENMDKAVAVFLCDLAKLSPEHQHIWKAKEISNGIYKLHPDYFRNSILGEFSDGISIFEAFLHEMKIINQMAQAIEKTKLFREDYIDNKPNGFSFLVRPTLKEFNDFIHLLDKIFSDNICKGYFTNRVIFDEEIQRPDGKIIVQPKGTIKLFEEWLLTTCDVGNHDMLSSFFTVFKKIRRLRQQPAHTINDDVFDQKYYHEQREIMKNAYESIRALRGIISVHPLVIAASIKIPDFLENGKIWIY